MSATAETELHAPERSTASFAALADGLVVALDEAWRSACAPLTEADALAAELAGIVERLDVPMGSLRALVRGVFGDEDALVPEDALIAEVPEVKRVLVRLGVLAKELDALPLRARAASRRVIELAMSAPPIVRQAAREVWLRGPSPDRDATLRRLEQMPRELKDRAEAIRAEIALLPVRADDARRRILEALRVRRRRLVRTDRLLTV